MRRHEIAVYVAAVRLATVDFGRGTVDPVQALLLRIPQRSFAQVIVGVDQQTSFNHGCLRFVDWDLITRHPLLWRAHGNAQATPSDAPDEIRPACRAT